jgi:Caspase domain
MMPRIVVPIVAVLLAAALSPAWADCDSSLSEARRIAAGISVTIAPADAPRAGVPIKISWTKRTAARPDMPTYVVLAAPPQVLAGSGFMALAANAVGPNQMQFGKAQSRALIAIYRDNDTADKGEFAVTPYAVGAQVYGWAVVTAGACGEQVLARGERTVTVDPGAAKLVVQNRFVIDNPTQRIRSRSGAYDIAVFKGRFEIRDAATNSVLLSEAGSNANFSPTGRFVAWQQADQFYSIADLVSGTVVATDIVNGFLAWAKADSYVIAGGDGWGAVRIKNVLVDASNLLNANADCHACVAWSSVQVAIDADRGFALVKGGFGWKIGDLFVTTSSDDLDFEESETNDALSHIRKVYDAGYPALPAIWSLGERLALSHIEPLSSDAKAQAKFLVQHNRLAAPIAVATRAADQELIGRAIAGGRTGNIEEIKNRTQTDLAFYSLGRFGIKTLPLAALEHSTSSYGANHQRNDNLSARIDGIRARLPAARTLFVKPADFDSRCDLSTAPDKKFNIDPAEVGDIWHWRGADGDRWIVLSEFSEGSGAFPQACVVLMRESSRQAVTLLNPDLLGIQSAGGQGIDLTVFRVTDSVVAIASQVTDRINGIRLVDAESGSVLGQLIAIVDGTMLSELRLTKDAKHLVQLNKDGRLFIYRVADGKPELQGAYIDNEIVVMADDGRYDTSYEGAESVQLRFAGIPGLFTVNQFEAVLRRSGIAKDVLENNNTASRSAALLSPPTIQLTLSAKVSAGQRSGKIIANSSRGLSAIHLHVDGRLVSTIPVQGQHVETPINLPDPGGARWVSAIAVDDQGLVSLPSTIQLPGPVRPRGVARVIAIGVDAYVDPTIPKLDSTKIDARHFAQAIATTQGHAFSSVQTAMLLDTDVTRDSVMNAVQSAVSQTGEDDTLIFFFAGHGVDGLQLDQPKAGFVLATNRTVVSDLANTSVPWTALASLLNTSKGTVVVILDACQAGIAGREAFATNDDVVSALFTKSGAPLVMLAASKGRQLSQEIANGGGGRFTNAIVAAITNERASYDSDHSGLVDLGELYAGVKTRVGRETQNSQTPWLARNRLVGEISLF